MCQTIIVAAKSKNNIIGNQNSLPWRLPSDLKNFRKLTENSVVLMGRKTYESIGKPLPNRHNIVISSNSNFKPEESIMVYADPNVALKGARVLCMNNNISNVFVIGGSQIYQAFIKRADKMILTVIDEHCEGDTEFPEFKKPFWNLVKSEQCFDPNGYMLENPNKKGLNYTIEEHERIM